MAKAQNTLKKLKNHPNFWVDPVSEIIYWRKTIKGKRFKKSTGTKKITEAKRIIEDYELSLTATSVKKAKSEKLGIVNPMITAVWNDLLEERQAKSAESTMKGYQSSWKKMEGFWGDKHIQDMSERTVRAFENWFLKEYKGDVFFNTGKHLRMLINYMVREGYLEKKIEVSNLDEVINAKYKRKKHFKVYTDSEIDRLFEASVGPVMTLALTVYFDTGMRKMELLSRKWEDLDLSNGLLNVWSQKNKRWREVPLTKRLVNAFKLYKKESETSPFIFPAARDSLTHIRSQVFDKMWVDTKRLAGIRGKARVHDIRHTFATKTAQDGWPIPIACKVLDMSAQEYMRTYTHINEKDIRGWMARSFEK